MSKTKKTTTKTTTTTTAMPEPQALAVVPAYDKKSKAWEATICEGKLEHVVLKDTFASDDAAKSAGEAWLASYAKADDAGRRKLLGWKPAKGGGGKAKAADAVKEKPKGKANREPKAKAASTRGPSGLDVAARLLKEAGAPAKLKDIVEQMLTKKLWSTNGKTPGATIYAAVIREIAEKGKASRFKKTDRGEFEYNAASEKA